MYYFTLSACARTSDPEVVSVGCFGTESGTDKWKVQNSWFWRVPVGFDTEGVAGCWKVEYSWNCFIWLRH